MIKLIVIVQFLLSFEMFGVMGIWSRAWFHDFVIVELPLSKILEIIGLSKTFEIVTVDSLYYFGVSGKIVWIMDV